MGRLSVLQTKCPPQAKSQRGGHACGHLWVSEPAVSTAGPGLLCPRSDSQGRPNSADGVLPEVQRSPGSLPSQSQPCGPCPWSSLNVHSPPAQKTEMSHLHKLLTVSHAPISITLLSTSLYHHLSPSPTSLYSIIHHLYAHLVNSFFCGSILIPTSCIYPSG